MDIDNKKPGSTILEQVQPSLKQPVTTTGTAQDVALIRAEERIMDEEITSEEESETVGKLERKHLTVALVKSVVESGGEDNGSPRYGLRKRRRPAGEDLEKLEHNQWSNEGGLARSRSNSKADNSDRPPSIPSSSTVPNPLAALQAPSPQVKSRPSNASGPDPITSADPPVPCPLPAAAVEEPLAEVVDKRKVTINEPALGRPRGFSIDLESVGLDFPEEVSSEGGRARAFSFECFAFGLNEDEPLPPLGHSDNDTISFGRPRQDSLILDPPSVGRPRGDSIIFDPSSFQDGGIHEQNALEKARAPAGDIPGVAKARSGSSSQRKPSGPKSGSAASKNRHRPTSGVNSKHGPTPAIATSSGVPPLPSRTSLPAVTSYTATTTTTTNSSTTTTVTVTASSNTAALSMDLLNKDGRIGIYLPEDRKARIARFHAKRARRIWRKRIKYDCRKKLADSRPRIKGRFVKRSDMEEE